MDGSSELKLENQVLIGNNRDLFLAGGNHSILRFMQGEELPESTVMRLHDNITRRRVLATQYGAEYFHLIAPEKYVVYPGNLPISNPGSMAQRYMKSGLKDAVYPVAELRKTRGGRSYGLTDTHWSLYGVLAIAELIARRFGIPETTVDAIAARVAAAIRPDGTEFQGDLGRKLEPKQGEPRLVFDMDFRETVHENGLGHDYTAAHNDGRMIVVDGEAACTDKVLMIFGDSYLYHALSVLSLFFRRIIFMRTRFFHEEMVAMARPDCIVSQMAERYMGSVSPDEAAPPFLFIPYILGRAPKMAEAEAEAFAAVFNGKGAFDPNIFRRRPPAQPVTTQSLQPSAKVKLSTDPSPPDLSSGQPSSVAAPPPLPPSVDWQAPFQRLRQFLHPQTLPAYDALLAKAQPDRTRELWRDVVPVITRGQDLVLSRMWRFSDRRILPILIEEILGHHEYFAETTMAEPRILDCGGNFGLATYYFRRIWPTARIEVFEPNPALAEIIRFNVSRNDFSDIAVHQSAISDHDGEDDFFVSAREDAASSLYADRAASEAKKIRVKTVALKDLLDEPVALLKLDIEGAEAAALKGAGKALRQCETIICETHAVNGRNTLLDVLGTLDDAGFEWAVGRSLWDERGDRFRFVRTVASDRSYCVFARRKPE